mmetsp:Transcript_6871/g.10012  ORF Transcript_6871/g.10012 Transcript_6871/m.10012 type:complete len:132 (-) Transcript_6871:984-1379(-)|eukprot:CAMPEP_0201686670 /NCGR_PEP_ID=MMETSP0578-20130828/1028_1 /ASSEMBLY_ACC=CAM_ASM_000663 /TAXON_ID=267565 /ORGANISM="Skeletonema grethea, Strain CCMP 1804" /LENGTH=131 /DNA_ID=CAMNT_0048170753 /DNA_START=48 /DNA_END=443 /DNA_ORIENTATION=+
MKDSFQLLLLALLSLSASVSCFVSPAASGRSKSIQLSMMMDQAPIVAEPASEMGPLSYNSALNSGIGNFISQDSSIMTSTELLSLKDRPPPPTPEEIAAKKATFNLWFWGGGFVAPFLATFYYFGFKFWER